MRSAPQSLPRSFCYDLLVDSIFSSSFRMMTWMASLRESW